MGHYLQASTQLPQQIYLPAPIHLRGLFSASVVQKFARYQSTCMSCVSIRKYHVGPVALSETDVFSVKNSWKSGVNLTPVGCCAPPCWLLSSVAARGACNLHTLPRKGTDLGMSPTSLSYSNMSYMTTLKIVGKGAVPLRGALWPSWIFSARGLGRRLGCRVRPLSCLSYWFWPSVMQCIWSVWKCPVVLHWGAGNEPEWSKPAYK